MKKYSRVSVQVKLYCKDGTTFEGNLYEAPHVIDVSKRPHREDGPAIEWADGTRAWALKGFYHREDGPAVEFFDGTKEWWLKGKQYEQEEFNNILKEVDSLEPAIGLLDPREWVRNRWKRRIEKDL